MDYRAEIIRLARRVLAEPACAYTANRFISFIDTHSAGPAFAALLGFAPEDIDTAYREAREALARQHGREGEMYSDTGIARILAAQVIEAANG